MKPEPIVSIIIPTYNRAHLISETLDSVLAQTYTYWECIIVDDGSTDTTDDILKTYCLKDARFQYHKRPDIYQSGGNGARNYGLTLSKGAYIQWFDDDDVMLPQHIATKVAFIEPDSIDFVVSKSKYLNSEEEFYHYNFKSQDITFETFSMGNVSWVTDDFMIKRAIALQVSFNENLRSGQEYNYCCKFLLHTEKALFINEYLTCRRDTETSIGKDRRQNAERYLVSRFHAYWLNYLDVIVLRSHHPFEKFSLITCISCYFRSQQKIELPKQFHKELYRVFSFKFVYFILAKWSQRLFNKYYFFYKRLKSIDNTL